MNKTSSTAAAILLSMALATQAAPLATAEATGAEPAPAAVEAQATEVVEGAGDTEGTPEEGAREAVEGGAEDDRPAGGVADGGSTGTVGEPEAGQTGTEQAGGGTAGDTEKPEDPAGDPDSAPAESEEPARPAAPTVPEAVKDAAPETTGTGASSEADASVENEASEEGEAEEASVHASLSADGTKVEVSAAGGAFARAWNVAYKVTGSNGVTWVAGQRQADGSWTATLDAASVGSGAVEISAWANVEGAQTQSYGTAWVTVPGVNADLSLSYDAASGAIVLSARNVSCPSGVSFVSAGLSANGGPASWYRLEQQADGSWQTAVDPGDSGWAAGAYTVTASICDLGWNGVSAGSVTFNLTYGEETVASALSDDLSTVTLRAAGGRFDAAWGVSFEVRGANGVTWVAASRGADGAWTVALPSSKVGLGSMTATAWANVKPASTLSLGSASLDVPSANARMSLMYDAASKKVRLVATSVACPSGVTFVSAGLTAPDGSIRWYRLDKQAEGAWSTEIDPSDLNWLAGAYTIQASICDEGWTGVNAGSTQTNLSFGEDTLDAVTDGERGTVTLTARGDVVAAAKNVAFAIVGDGTNGHTGTTWHQATRQADGSWTATVSASVTGSGACSAQTVAITGSATQYLETTRYSIARADGATAVSDLSSAGTMDVVVENVTCSTGVQSVALGVFAESYSKWYPCARQADGSWTATVSVSDLSFAGGTYTFEPVVADNFGNALPLEKVTKQVTLSTTSVESEVDGAYGTLWLVAQGGASEYAWGVAFAVTDASGSTTWVSAEKNEAGAWCATLPASSLSYGGGTATAYVNTDFGSYVMGSSYFARPVGSGMLSVIRDYASPTEYLLAIDTSNCRVGVYTGRQGHWQEVAYWYCSPGAWSTPTVTGVFSVGEKGYYFDSYGSRCFYYTQFYGDYLFHSILYYPSGAVMDSRLGMNLSHGCVRLATENAYWIYSNIPTGTTVVSY